MGFNIMDLAKDALTSQVIGKASEFLGEDAHMLSKGFGAAVPSILAAIASKSADTSSAGNLLGMIKEGGFDGGMLDNLGDVFSGGAATSGVLDAGSGLLKIFLGDKISKVSEIISKVSGIGSGSSNRVLSLSAPMIMSLIGRAVKNKALDAVGLGKLMDSQANSITRALPAGMGSLLGLDNILEEAKDTNSDVGTTVVDKAISTTKTISTKAKTTTGDLPSYRSVGLMKWVLPALLVLGFLLAYQQGCFSNARDSDMDASIGKVDITKDIMDKAESLSSSTAETIVDDASVVIEDVNFSTGSVGDQFSKFLTGGGSGNQQFTFKNLNFVSGTGNIESGFEEIENLATVLKAYPKVSIEINGYTDSKGNDDNNLALSELRANTVLQRLIANGVDPTRLSAVGHGEANPIGDNNTTSGQAKNRRIEIQITSK